MERSKLLVLGTGLFQINNGAGNSCGMILLIFVLVVPFHSVLCYFDFCEGNFCFGSGWLVGFVSEGCVLSLDFNDNS